MQSNTGSEEHLETPILQYAGGVIAAKLDRTEKELVHGVSFHISRGESLALIGETPCETVPSIIGLPNP